MNRLMMITSVLCLALESGEEVHAQGTLVFNNLGTNNGLVFIYADRFGGTPTLLNQDLNFALLAGPPGMNPLGVAHKWLLSDGSAKGINVGTGLFADPTAGVFSISGVPPGEAVNVQVVSWGGNYNAVGEAMGAGAGIGVTPLFTMFAGSDTSPPASLRGMPQLNIFGVPSVPEPGTMKLMSIGGIALWFLLHRSRRPEGLRCSTMRGPELR